MIAGNSKFSFAKLKNLADAKLARQKASQNRNIEQMRSLRKSSRGKKLRKIEISNKCEAHAKACVKARAQKSAQKSAEKQGTNWETIAARQGKKEIVCKVRTINYN